jgi:hypothetical protein
MEESKMNEMKNYTGIENMKIHVRSFFANLDFNAEEHLYKYDGKSLISVSGVIKKFTEPFDADKIAGFVAKKRSREEGRKVTKAEILQEWEDMKNHACDQGTSVHNFGENYTKDSKPTNGFEIAIESFWKSLPEHIVPFMFELQMFSEKLGIAGTADIILYNIKTGKFIIADYKTNKDLFKNFKGKKMLKPFTNLLDSPFNKYQIQLSMYQHLFEQCGFEVEKRVVIWLKPDATFETYETENLISKII